MACLVPIIKEIELCQFVVRMPEHGRSREVASLFCSSVLLPRSPAGAVRLAAWLAHGSVPGITTSPNLYRGFRYPAEVIQHVVWLYHCFSLSLRDIGIVLATREIVVSYESIRAWSLRFGRLFANTLKRRRPKLGDKLHLDEVCIRIPGKQHYLWRAIGQDGHGLVKRQVLCRCDRQDSACRLGRRACLGMSSELRWLNVGNDHQAFKESVEFLICSCGVSLL